VRIASKRPSPQPSLPWEEREHGYHFAMPSRADWARVGFQGEPGAYSEEAALAILPAAVTVGYPTFSRAFDAVAGREVDAAVLPVENSLGGIVQEVNDLLWERSGLRISGEVIHPVRHCLLGRGEPVVRALSHPQALLQCRRFLEARQIQAVTYHDTAGAARAVAEGMVVGSAAIASAAAAKRYGLKILAEGIQDDDSNQTRFLIIDLGPVARPGAPGLTKASLAFIGSHKPGSLVAALQSLSTRGINLTRLDSRPMPDRPWQYRFYVDFEVDDPAKANEALEALAKETTEVKLFGTYPAAGE
jgi:prephenate dehydratase